MSDNMSSAIHIYDQEIMRRLDNSPADVRECVDAAAIARAWATRLLSTAGDRFTLHQRQNLYDLSRKHRESAINRSPFGLLFSLAPLAPLDAATFGPARLEVEIAMRGTYQLPSEDVASEHEERSNFDGNIAQQRRRERKTKSTLYDLTDTMNGQVQASKQLALAAAASR